MSACIPKSEIVESGDGYIKYSDGTMISFGLNTGVANSYRTVNFPVSFKSTPAITLLAQSESLQYVFTGMIYSQSASGFNAVTFYKEVSSATTGIGATVFDWIAVGKWR